MDFNVVPARKHVRMPVRGRTCRDVSGRLQVVQHAGVYPIEGETNQWLQFAAGIGPQALQAGNRLFRSDGATGEDDSLEHGRFGFGIEHRKQNIHATDVPYHADPFRDRRAHLGGRFDGQALDESSERAPGLYPTQSESSGLSHLKNGTTPQRFGKRRR
jgi:hypothetical protein